MLFEVNDRLLENPRLLTEKVYLAFSASYLIIVSKHQQTLFSDFQPECEGYIAFVNPKKLESATCMSHLKSREQYQELLRAREAGTVEVAAQMQEDGAAAGNGDEDACDTRGDSEEDVAQ